MNNKYEVIGMTASPLTAETIGRPTCCSLHEASLELVREISIDVLA